MEFRKELLRSQKITKEDLGGSGMAVDAAGTIENVAADEAQCFQMVRRYLSFMPSNVWELPPVTDCDDPVDRCDEALASIIPLDRRKPYNMRKLIGMIVDKGSVFGFKHQREEGSV